MTLPPHEKRTLAAAMSTAEFNNRLTESHLRLTLGVARILREFILETKGLEESKTYRFLLDELLAPFQNISDDAMVQAYLEHNL